MAVSRDPCSILAQSIRFLGDDKLTKLKELRTSRGITQQELADALGTNQKVISSWETGNATPRPAMMQKVEDYFGVPKEDIFFEAFNYSD